MALYKICEDEAALLAVAKAASPKVIAVKIKAPCVYVETSEDLTAAEESAVKSALDATPTMIEKEPQTLTD